MSGQMWTRPALWAHRACRLSGLFFVWTLLLLMGCTATAPLSTVSSCYPAVVANFTDATITLSGSFVTQLQVQPTSGMVRESKDFQVVLRSSDGSGNPDVVLEDVTYLSNEQLSAVVPAQVAVGKYAIAVTDPRGTAAVVDSSVILEVTRELAYRATFSNEFGDTRARMPANTETPLFVQIVDRFGEPVASSEKVILRLLAPYVHFVSYDLGEPMEYELADYPHLVGVTNDSGQATINILSDEATGFTFSVQSVDLEGSGQETDDVANLPADQVVEMEVYESVASSLQVTVGNTPNADGVVQVAAGSPLSVTVNVYPKGSGNQDGEFVLYTSAGQVLGAENVSPYPPTFFNGRWDGNVQLFETGQFQLIAATDDPVLGFSDPFEILPAAPVEVEVEVVLETGGDGVFNAGDLLSFAVSQVDSYGNQVPIGPSALLDATDESHSLNCTNLELVNGNASFEGCYITRSNEPTEPNRISAWVDGLLGVSPSFDVEPGPTARYVVQPDFVESGLQGYSIVAGASFGVTIQAVDSYDNVDFNNNGDLWIQDDPSEGEPELTGETRTLDRGVVRIDPLVLTRARDLTFLVAEELSAQGPAGASEPFAVLPADPAQFVVSASPTELVAGESVTVALEAQDAYDNHIPDYSTDAVTLRTSSGESHTVASTFEDGSASLSVALTRAGRLQQLTAAAGDVEGTFSFLDILPGPLFAFAIEDVPSTVFVDVPFKVGLEAQDAYGNRVTGFEDTVNLSDQTGTLSVVQENGSLIQPYEVGPLVDGFLDVQLEVAVAQLDDRLFLEYPASGETFSGQSGLFDVFDLSCDPGYSPTISVGGGVEYFSACLDEHTGGVTVEFVSLPEGSPPPRLIWDFGDGTLDPTSNQTRVSHTFSSVGRFMVTVTAVDDKLCADDDQLPVYIGLSDGSPSGRMTVTGPNEPLELGSSQAGTFYVTAKDCSGDAAVAPSGSPPYVLTVQAGLGRLLLPNGDYNPDQPGLQLPLDTAGQATFALAVDDVSQGDAAKVYLQYEGGEAEGFSEVQLIQDLKSPIVVDYYPAGHFLGDLSVIWLDFNEPVRSSTATSADVVSVESSVRGKLPLASQVLTSGGARLELTLQTPITLSSSLPEQITVRLVSGYGKTSIADDPDGNRLDGDWFDDTDKSQPDDFVMVFGSGIPEVAVGGPSECSASEVVFSPDGQDGDGSASDGVYFSSRIDVQAGIKAVAVEIRPLTSDDPAAWLWQGRDGGAEADAPLSLDFELYWNGVGLADQVLPNGIYTWRIWAIDVDDNWLSGSCDDELIQIDNPIDFGAYP